MSTVTETETGTTASTSSVAVAVAASLNTVLETNSKESNGIITNDIDIPAPRTRSVFPTTDETSLFKEPFLLKISSTLSSSPIQQ